VTSRRLFSSCSPFRFQGGGHCSSVSYIHCWLSLLTGPVCMGFICLQHVLLFLRTTNNARSSNSFGVAYYNVSAAHTRSCCNDLRIINALNLNSLQIPVHPLHSHQYASCPCEPQEPHRKEWTLPADACAYSLSFWVDDDRLLGRAKVCPCRREHASLTKLLNGIVNGLSITSQPSSILV